MAKSFDIKTAGTSLKTDARQHAEAVFTVTNVGMRPVRGMARVTPLGDTKQEWLSIAGESDRDFSPGASQELTVNFDASAAPRPGGASGARYPFRLVVASAMNPDEDFTASDDVTVETAPDGVPPPPPKPKWWIIPVVAVVLIGIALGAWLLLRTKKVDVPNVVGKPVADATQILSDGNLKANVVDTKVTGRVPEGVVAEQSPGSGSVAEGSTVELIVEAPKPSPSPVATKRVNLALDKNTRQSTTILNALSDRAVDGNTNGSYFVSNSVTHTEITANAWWQVDLGAVQPIAQINIWNRTDCCPERLSNYYVFVSNAPFSSNDLNTTLSQPGVSAFPQPATAGSPTIITVGKPGRFVRVQLVGSNYLSLAEVEVMGDVAAPERGQVKR